MDWTPLAAGERLDEATAARLRALQRQMAGAWAARNLGAEDQAAFVGWAMAGTIREGTAWATVADQWRWATRPY